jgi:F0F1-type ATP synthase membrane subunit b/b'
VAYSAKEKAKEAFENLKEETEELSKRMLKIAKGALDGMVEGAKKSMKDEEK